MVVLEFLFLPSVFFFPSAFMLLCVFGGGGRRGFPLTQPEVFGIGTKDIISLIDDDVVQALTGLMSENQLEQSILDSYKRCRYNPSRDRRLSIMHFLMLNRSRRTFGGPSK